MDFLILKTKTNKGVKTMKKWFCLTLPICLIGCGIMIAIENLCKVKIDTIIFGVWGFASAIIAEVISQKYNLFREW